ncbi:MAG: tRNA lysidine(34) synthetase TilS, partial [Verrucomicrobia bacterium 21-51-4]
MSNSLSVPNLAIRLADIFPRQRWHPRALAFLESQLGAPWAIACSGGADSLLVCLLSWAYWPEQRNRLTVLHYNHALRAEASDADANFVAQMAEALGIPCIQQRAAANVTNHSSEASLRDARYSFLESAMHPRGAHTLLLGHQADDVAETFLMRLARGSGLGGLVAPRPLTQIGQIWRVRPLIDISKKDIQTALESVGLVWREDASNAGGSYLRNRVRNAVMPVLEAVLGADWLAGVQASRELLEEDATALDAWAATVLSHARTGQPLDWRPIAHAPLAVQRRALYRWLAGFKLVLEKASFEAVLKNLNQGQAGSWN